MGDIKNMSKIISELSQQWIGKHGVWAILDQGQDCLHPIKFLVDDLEKNKKKLPNSYKGLRITFEESGRIISH